MTYYKVATDDETKDIVRMAKSFFEASPYSSLGIEEKDVADLVSQFTRKDADKLCLCLMDDEKAVGVFGAIAVKNIFNSRYSCIEMMWWIDPEYRSFKNAKYFLEVYEYWARHKVKAQVIQLISLDKMDVSKLYTRAGFQKSEETYIKEL